MFIRIAALTAPLVITAHIGLCLMAYNATSARAEFASARVEYKRLRNDNRPSRLRNGIRRVLEARAKGLNWAEREKLLDSILRCSYENGHDPFLLLALIETESSFRRNAVSVKGAVGLMQVRPFVAMAIAREMEMGYVAAKALADADINLRIGSYYLAKMIRRFGDLSLALEAYNQGPTKLLHHLKRGGKLRKLYTRKVFRNREKILRLASYSI